MALCCFVVLSLLMGYQRFVADFYQVLLTFKVSISLLAITTIAQLGAAPKSRYRWRLYR